MFAKDVAGDALGAEEPDHDLARCDLAAPLVERFAQAEHERFFGPRGEWKLDRFVFAAAAPRLSCESAGSESGLDASAHRVQIDPQCRERGPVDAGGYRRRLGGATADDAIDLAADALGGEPPSGEHERCPLVVLQSRDSVAEGRLPPEAVLPGVRALDLWSDGVFGSMLF